MLGVPNVRRLRVPRPTERSTSHWIAKQSRPRIASCRRERLGGRAVHCAASFTVKRP